MPECRGAFPRGIGAPPVSGFPPVTSSPGSPGTITAAPPQDTPIPEPLWTHSGLWAWGQGQISSQDQSTHHLGTWPSRAPGPPAACGQKGVRVGEQGHCSALILGTPGV